MSKGAFYYHFASKQTLFMELLNTWLAELESSLAVAASGARTAPQKLSDMAGMIDLRAKDA